LPLPTAETCCSRLVVKTQVDDELIALFRAHDGKHLDVRLREGSTSPVFNIAWGYDMGDSYAHVTTNISPEIDEQPIDFFFTYAVVAVSDPSTGSELFRSEPLVDHDKVFGNWTKDTILELLSDDDPHVLPHIPIVVSMDPPDCRWALSICIALAGHVDATIRGNAVLGFGHLARNCPDLNVGPVAPILRDALEDRRPYVRGQANSAKDDIEHFHQLELTTTPNGQPSFRRRKRA